MMPDENETIVREIAGALLAKGLTCATAESCTGGMIGAALTSVPGSSEWYRGGIIAYANGVKEKLLSVARPDLEAYGAVSRAVVLQMALGACAATGADAAVSTSGVAGPGGGTPEKPVGTVWIGWAVCGQAKAEKFLFSGNREEIRRQAVRLALQGLAGAVKESG